MPRKGFSAIELLVGIVIVGTLVAIAIPSLGSTKQAMDFSRAEQEVLALFTRARWSAINSGRAATRITLESGILRIRAGTAGDSPIVAALDVSSYGATIADAANFPITLTNRGFRQSAEASFDLENSHISSERSFTVGVLGKITTA